MGTWGISLSSSDTFSDIYSSFYDLYNEKKDIEATMLKLRQEYKEIIEEEDESNEFYFAVAKAQWECGLLQDNYLNKIKEIIDSKSEIKRWISLEGDPKDAEKRQTKIIELYEKIRIQNIKPRKPKTKKLIDSELLIGECISIKGNDGFYCAAVTLSEEKNTEYGLNQMLVLDYYNNELPNIKYFENGNCLLEKDTLKDSFSPYIIHCYKKDLKRIEGEFIRIGKINITINYSTGFGRYYGSWNSIFLTAKKVSEKCYNVKPQKAKIFYKKRFSLWKLRPTTAST